MKPYWLMAVMAGFVLLFIYAELRPEPKLYPGDVADSIGAKDAYGNKRRRVPVPDCPRLKYCEDDGSGVVVCVLDTDADAQPKRIGQ